MTLIYNPKTVVKLEPCDSGISHSIVRVNNSMVDSKKQDRNRFFRREALLIKNLDNDASIIRFVMGSNSLKGLTKDAIALDYDATDTLGIETYTDNCNLSVQRATRWQLYMWFYNHPDLLIQISSRLAIFGALMGILGFGIGILSIATAFI